MPSPFCETDLTNLTGSTDACATAQQLLALNEKLRSYVAWQVDCDNGNLPALAFAREVGAILEPPGSLRLHMSATVPGGDNLAAMQAEVERRWLTQDEINENAVTPGTHQPFWTIAPSAWLGRYVRFGTGTADGQPFGTLGGAPEVVLGEANLPPHAHSMGIFGTYRISINDIRGQVRNPASAAQAPDAVETFTGTGKGEAKPVLIEPSYLAVVPIVRTNRMT